jgi:putative membrane protein
LRNTLLITAVATMAAMTVRAADDQTTPGSPATPSKADSKTISFIKDAAKDNNLEISMAEVGAQKATNPELKSFCQQLQQDHTQANLQLQPLAQKYGVSIEQPIKGLAHHEMNKFEKEESGSKFDQDFATEMLKSHQKDIKKFQEASINLQDADVKQYAQTMLPKLQQHFDRAVTVAKAVGVEDSTISSYSKKLPAGVGGTTDSDVDTTKGAGARDQKNGASGSDLNPPPSSSAPINK